MGYYSILVLTESENVKHRIPQISPSSHPGQTNTTCHLAPMTISIRAKTCSTLERALLVPDPFPLALISRLYPHHGLRVPPIQER